MNTASTSGLLSVWRRTLARLAAVAGCVLSLCFPPGALGQPGPPDEVPLDDGAIISVFEDLLGREPTRRELREWRARSEGMTVEELEDEIRHTREFRHLTPEQIVRDAFRDLLDREPDSDGMRHYRRRIIERGWTAGDVRDAIRDSEEYRVHEADIIIDRAFDDLLEREPKDDERAEYRRRLLKDGTEDGIRNHIRKSEEYRYTIPREKITRAYREILERDPDPEGLEHYRKRMVNDGWGIDRVRSKLFDSAEYKQKHPKKRK